MSVVGIVNIFHLLAHYLYHSVNYVPIFFTAFKNCNELGVELLRLHTFFICFYYKI